MVAPEEDRNVQLHNHQVLSADASLEHVASKGEDYPFLFRFFQEKHETAKEVPVDYNYLEFEMVKKAQKRTDLQ